MKKTLILLACILTSFFSYTQITFQKTYGGIGFNQGFSVVQTRDGGYAVTGNKSNADVYIIRTNLYGDTLWTKTYGGSLNDYGYSIVQTNDDGFIITGGKFIENFFHVYLIKTNSTGDTIWTKTYGNKTVNSFGNSVIQLNDNGYIISGYTDNKSQGGLCSIYLIRTNERGDTIWTKKIMGDYDEFGYNIVQSNDNGYAVAGKIGSKICLLKIDTDGEILWTKTYDEEMGNSISKTTDGGYIIAGTTNSLGSRSYDACLIKTNSFGDTLWTKTFGGTNSDFGNSVAQTNDGGYIISGETKSFGADTGDVYLLKTDTDGVLLWSRTFGGTKYDFSKCVVQTNDDGFIIAGSTESFDANWRNVFLIKTNGNGIVTSNDEVLSTENNGINIFPNPTTGRISIQIPQQFGKIKKLELVDCIGQLRIKQIDSFAEIDISSLTSGLYFIVLTNFDNEKVTTKIIKK